jgi:ABC-type multidrug transport system ATPase subunit
MAPPYWRQTWTLTKKTLRICCQRKWLTTLIRAVIAPIVFVFFVGYMKELFVAPSEYGIGTPVPIRSFGDGLRAATGGRDDVVFVNSGFTGGQIGRVIDSLTTTVRDAGKNPIVVDNEDATITICRNSLRGASGCYGAVVFYSSPSEGEGGIWNYTLRADGALGEQVFVDQNDNDQQIYILPFQHAIDLAIVDELGDDSVTLPETINNFPYTDKTSEEREADIRRLYMNSVLNFVGIAYILGMIGVVYHLVGKMAQERELGMSQLIEAMVPNRHRWHTQAVRLFALHLSMDIIWAPGWIAMGIVLKALVYTQTSYGIVIIWQILSGLAFSSWAILGGSFFSRAQLSGITVVIVSLVLGIIVQVQTPNGTAAVGVLSLLFTPMNYIFHVLYLARFERIGAATNLLNSAPPRGDDSTWEVPGIALWICLIIQIIVFPLLGAIIERSRYGTSSTARKVSFNKADDSTTAITLQGFQKSYVPGWWSRKVSPMFGGDKKSVVQAVKGLDLQVLRGQILCLLGANGSGKSTTLDAIAGLGTVTGGEIHVDGRGGIGYCPQKNVLWDELTVFEHVRIFNGLKAMGARDDKETIMGLIRACDLEHKAHAKSRTLSGGQKRKLQLAMMFTGGSRVCCIDEISSGLDPLSRRKIWEILLAERESRSMLLTTHFLDEADVLSDYIVVMSKGHLKAEGSAAELKHKYGGNYLVEVRKPKELDEKRVAAMNGISSRLSSDLKSGPDSYAFECADSAEVARFVEEIEKDGFTDYTVHGPSIEDVFLNLSEEARDEESSRPQIWSEQPKGEEGADVPPISYVKPKAEQGDSTPKSSGSASSPAPKGLNLITGHGTSLFAQTWILFKKRFTILRRNYIPYLLAVAIPIIVAGLASFFLEGFEGLSCNPIDSVNIPDMESIATDENVYFLLGPSQGLNTTLIDEIRGENLTRVQFADSLAEFQGRIGQQYGLIQPGGIYLSDPPTIAYVGNYWLHYSVITNNFLTRQLTGLNIATQYKMFALPFTESSGDTLQLLFYFGLAMCAYPGFFALYPTRERLHKVRALHYSNGVRAGSLWLAYTLFDFIFVLIVSVLVTVVFAAVSSAWYHLEYVFVVFFLYGLTSTLISYVVSLYTSSLLAAFAIAVGYQGSMFAIYFVAYMSITTFSPAYAIDRQIEIAHFAMAAITPSGNLLRAMLLTLNEFSILCDGNERASYPGAITVFGGPILYLILQAIGLFVFLVWYDSGYEPAFLRRFSKKKKDPVLTDSTARGDDVLAEISRTESSKAGLQVQHVVKSFAEVTAVEDITFSVSPSECFALLGPNGAGKSTTISLIRGDIRPDHGDVLVEGTSITHHRALARKQLGVCPQFDAMDNMTVTEHLRFYAQARGVSDIAHNVDALINAVNLIEYRDRLAHRLSGGNKRKLSLAIALVGNPAVLLLDEPSSGMDAANKRFLWKTLAEVTKGRSMLITTHSLEEADRLADKVGIMAMRMLALGTSEELRDRFGEHLYVQAVLQGAPHVPEERTIQTKTWIERHLEGVLVEERMWYGQLRFSVPVHSCSIAKLFQLLEDKKQELGLEYYSVSRATLDQVFLEVVNRHNVEEEGANKPKPKRKWWRSVLDDA